MGRIKYWVLWALDYLWNSDAYSAYTWWTPTDDNAYRAACEAGK